jgi:hypothetical protein
MVEMLFSQEDRPLEMLEAELLVSQQEKVTVPRVVKGAISQ